MAPRNTNSAYFVDEQDGKVSPEGGGFLNKFKWHNVQGPNALEHPIGCDLSIPARNYLDPFCVIDEGRPELRVKLRQPQVFIPVKNRNQRGPICLYIGSKTWKNMLDARADGKAPPQLKISLLFGIGNDVDNLGLRYFFEQVNDRLLINIPGIEQEPKWGIGITGLKNLERNIISDQINTVINFAFENTVFKAVRYKIATLAAYSTGYRGLNQTVNEGLIPLDDIETVVYYDCVYRSDNPKPAKDDDDPPESLTKIEKMHKNCVDESNETSKDSAYNTRRALTRIDHTSTKKVNFVAYMSTPKGSPLYPSIYPSNSPSKDYTVDFPTKIDLRTSENQNALFAIAITRCLRYAQLDGQINSTQVPSEFKALESDLPGRGTVASSDLTYKPKNGFTPQRTLHGYWTSHKDKIQLALKEGKGSPMGKAFQLISGRELIYRGGYPSPGNEMGILHFALIPEFGWEYLL